MLGELSLPETKYVLRDVQFGRHLAYGPERIRRFFRSVHKPCSRQQLFTSSRSSWLARKVSTRRASIGTSMPVFGFRPMRRPLSRRIKVPKPEIFTDRKSTRLNSSH